MLVSSMQVDPHLVPRIALNMLAGLRNTRSRFLVFDQSIWIQDDTLRILRDKSVLGANIWALIVTVISTLVSVALPKGDYFGVLGESLGRYQDCMISPLIDQPCLTERFETHRMVSLSLERNCSLHSPYLVSIR